MLITETSIVQEATCIALIICIELFAQTVYLNKDFRGAF